MFQQLLKSPGPPLIGTFVKLPALEVAEIIGAAGFDFVVIDTEHALLSVRDVYSLVVVYSRLNVAPLVRITDHGYGDGQRYLDAGAAGILVPHVSNAAQAEATMKQFLFPPAGTRGMGYAARAGLWGSLDGGPAEYVRTGQEDVARVAMIEEREAVEDIDGILAAPGVDAAFIGPGDLSLSMGVPGGSPPVHEAVTRSIEAAVRAGVPVGTVVQGEEQLRLRAAQGCRFLLVGNDTGMLSGAARRTLAQAREAVAEPAGVR
ncbi:2-dehydro-3-deoxyglucarate aldolase/4-hydroxy-2-oxoheptanedioate aldolase [Amycolatopsis sacchari]|uniref:2-dehydro-3-deoxyglucarate aldolase/4-hydroxy-2-oxoheptanedioate aldolase n=1 Tax=Amycolatopsis sacchari TaxID=115433 RepID=A0A1I3T0I2_9PSEU|nr:aldolase/citrate lyase family protein [Amycolatopsis sacchari]SFJ64170.1 2-dehydro-3-deoxyglucarate aldolase/4-hydroxy-2-oxoheptanedioate aldolase [Amycolatopsis sacchari]